MLNSAFVHQPYVLSNKSPLPPIPHQLGSPFILQRKTNENYIERKKASHTIQRNHATPHKHSTQSTAHTTLTDQPRTPHPSRLLTIPIPSIYQHRPQCNTASTTTASKSTRSSPSPFQVPNYTLYSTTDLFRHLAYYLKRKKRKGKV